MEYATKSYEMAGHTDEFGQLLLQVAPTQDPGFDFAQVLRKRKEAQRPPMPPA